MDFGYLPYRLLQQENSTKEKNGKKNEPKEKIGSHRKKRSAQKQIWTGVFNIRKNTGCLEKRQESQAIAF
ncbi:hypothetical protein [Allobaculum sp. JKK-2023]|uniref:hypothetical protein n=1 Tax=Allobaculum sp. JKK-2023 TaxID=3108943 RepID=UPI002B061B5D|nr:hypothetical protein [Allobaculum sp. JKK-2023]